MPADANPPLSCPDQKGPIECQCCHRRTTGRRLTGHTCSILCPDEVFNPQLLARIEECCRQSGQRVGCHDLVALIDVALTAGSPEVGTTRQPAQRLRQHVLYFQRRTGDLLARSTVTAPPACIDQHLISQPASDAGSGHARVTRSATSTPRCFRRATASARRTITRSCRSTSSANSRSSSGVVPWRRRLSRKVSSKTVSSTVG